MHKIGIAGGAGYDYILFGNRKQSLHCEEDRDNIRDELIDANDKIKRRDTRTIQVNDRLVVVTPTYAWRIPWLVRDWIRKTHFQGVRQVWFVMSCGAEIGNAAKYNRLLCEEKDFDYMGTAQIVSRKIILRCFIHLKRRKQDKSYRMRNL